MFTNLKYDKGIWQEAVFIARKIRNKKSHEYFSKWKCIGLLIPQCCKAQHCKEFHINKRPGRAVFFFLFFFCYTLEEIPTMDYVRSYNPSNKKTSSLSHCLISSPRSKKSSFQNASLRQLSVCCTFTICSSLCENTLNRDLGSANLLRPLWAADEAGIPQCSYFHSIPLATSRPSGTLHLHVKCSTRLGGCANSAATLQPRSSCDYLQNHLLVCE